MASSSSGKAGVPGVLEVRIAKPKPKFLTFASSTIVDQVQREFSRVVKSRNVDVAEGFIDAGVDVNQCAGVAYTAKEFPICAAVGNGDFHMTKLLLEAGATPMKSCVGVSLGLNRVDIAKLLLTHGAELNLRSQSVLTRALACKHMEAAEFMIEQGMGTSGETTWERQTPLHLVAKSCFVDFGIALIRNGAVVDAADREGKTPLYYAVNHQSHEKLAGNLPLIQALLDHGADPDCICAPRLKYKTPRQKLDASCLAKDVVYCTE